MAATLKTFGAWQENVPERIRVGPLWSFGAYPKASFLYELVWSDCGLLMKDVRGRTIVEQLIRSAGSISANIEEGYARGFGKEYARFLEFALSSARETQGWYHRARHLLLDQVLEHRLAWLDEIISLLMTTMHQQRRVKRKQNSANSESRIPNSQGVFP